MAHRLAFVWLLLTCWACEDAGRADEGASSPPAARGQSPRDERKPWPPGVDEAPTPAGDTDDAADEAAEASGAAMVPTTGPQLEEAIRDTKAQAVLVNLWASWCGSCRDEVPMLVSVAEDFAGHGVELILLSADEPARAEEAEAFLRQRGLPLPGRIVEGPIADLRLSLHPRWSGAIPATFLFDGDGDLAYYWAGPLRVDELLPVLEAFLAGEDVQGMALPKLGEVPPERPHE